MDIREKQQIEQILSRLKQLLRGKKAEPLKIDDCPECLSQLSQSINELVYSFSEIWDFILPLSQGMLNIEPPKARNLLASPFKELHSQLRTLVWQVQQIAQGDYNQRVVFMGEFSQVFNSLVEALEEKSRLAQEHIKFLEKEAEKLREGQLRYASAVKNSPGGIFIFDPITLKVIETNEKFNTMMGYSKEEISELTVSDLYFDQDIAKEDLRNILGKSLHSISNRQYLLKTANASMSI